MWAWTRSRSPLFPHVFFCRIAVVAALAVVSDSGICCMVWLVASCVWLQHCMVGQWIPVLTSVYGGFLPARKSDSHLFGVGPA